MSRWINADDLIEDFKNDLINSRMEALRGNPHDSILISNVIERIQDAPTVFNKQILVDYLYSINVKADYKIEEIADEILSLNNEVTP